ncbi:MAG: hypothetical protein HUJ27_03240 [Rhodobacteraceae bacterium]|nr:hypothetical protein [Paracoccaceae bacterium]
MGHPVISKFPATWLALAALIPACTSHPRIEAGRLAARSAIEVQAHVTDRFSLETTAYSRSEGMAKGAVGGAAGGAAIWMNELGFYALVLAPAAIPLTVAAGAGIGAVGGAVTGTSHSREDIELAKRALAQEFRPKRYERRLEAYMSHTLREDHFEDGAPCIASRAQGRRCPRDTGYTVLNVQFAFQFEPPRSGGGNGALDLVSYASVWADPHGVLSPECITWKYRHRVGNLFDLAQGGEEELDRVIHEIIPDFTAGLAQRVFDPRRSGAQNSPRPSKSGRWERQGCHTVAARSRG